MSLTYSPPLPFNFVALSYIAEDYPITRDELVWTAQEAVLGESMVHFLRRFGSDRVFASPDDFVASAEDLEALEQQQKESPLEYLRSPQD